MKRIAIIGISGKLGQYLTEHALERGLEVTGLCRPESTAKLDRFAGRIALVPGQPGDPQAVARAVRGADAVLTVLVPWGTDGLATRTAGAVLTHARPGARLVFSCGWHVPFDRRDRYRLKDRVLTGALGLVARLGRQADLGDQVRAARRVFASDTAWTVVRASTLEEGDSEGLPVWAPHVGDPVLASNRTRRTDLALFMIHALTDDSLVRKAPAIVSRASGSARAHRQAALPV